ncbi:MULTISPECIES: nicotinate-nucleotide--dimethylbenzimidazole phosphoribosyltransferase [Gordonia]|jgi:nicotinate-nucleotide--dimethylbenzimidazole phosphoribosyltransferase|uniref:Nicotinate-nucleotide--dimethylbenzimidazole phosphoribosyltransferase n=1 Tax=Gordonia alkanivorans CGMCC 6845 TaxID=1423140 RepID=W9D7F4_9ACTN|nr:MULTISPECIES: nicotinate-nucleotide--dimethylbenzimidazole phosphoribosyltransferase [Gordonia]ETA05188.1 nicotinate-nucleotide--dimethylbenzimidazole phosphoribosyltransferase [Gordonia alkanivorans CGMCC 6845]MDH3016730.1 nicotinate-nucleotide--dimethylbenzimidazole phosphoribosyltransferase [Gordonia alkanivorans]MDH3022111.1 nicotinate-nucleotide--dimethylbenzimidazole phosphoribosyltransferase [Gordonia alkanivorans]MDH3024994.1 nicotinate-nucleotide--dimethylbenzimidazole phosphoribosy
MADRATRTLVLGGVRSGKSAHGESLLRAHQQIRYLATGPVTTSDAEWTARVNTHRQRRDARYTTIETTDLAEALRAAPDIPALVDDLGSWLTARIDAVDGWESGSGIDLDADITELCDSLRAMNADVVLISSEVGLSLVPPTPAGRLFQDLLGTLNSAVAQACDRVSLVVAGRVLDLPADPSAEDHTGATVSAAPAPAVAPVPTAPVATPAPVTPGPVDEPTPVTTAAEVPDPTDAEVFGPITPPSEAVAFEARERQKTLTKPPGSLGRLEEIGVWISACQGQCPPAPITSPSVAVFAGDHGVARGGVSAFPPEVTAQMVANISSGGAAVNVMAARVGATVMVVDMSVDADTSPHLSTFKVRRSSEDLRTTDSITLAEARAALAAGRAIADRLIDSGSDLLIAGEMGIGNTTPATVLIGALTRREPVEIVGRGTGVDDHGWMRKTAAIRDGMRRARKVVHDPLALLAAVGGADLTATAGFLAQAALRRTPVILDGVVITAAAMVANELAPGAMRWWIAGHRSVEPAHQIALDHLDLEPVLDLSMRLGEGSGAVLALPVVQSAADILISMATFAEAGVTDRDDAAVPEAAESS